ncbi:hypothetical protein HON22_02185 [Candidatus Peregrinibacteria bacterium]|mgnify:CR=1 FL=1|jgi:hypothetical protein|nr:hypothetical protein [Candidatus Peregrinibacteria bacterium]
MEFKDIEIRVDPHAEEICHDCGGMCCLNNIISYELNIGSAEEPNFDDLNILENYIHDPDFRENPYWIPEEIIIKDLCIETNILDQVSKEYV